MPVSNPQWLEDLAAYGRAGDPAGLRGPRAAQGIVPPPREPPEVEAAWNAAEIIPGLDPARFRRSGDALRATIRRDRYNGRRAFAWTIEDGTAVYDGHHAMMAALTRTLRRLRGHRAA